MGYTFIHSEEIMDWEGRKRARFVNSLSGFKSATLIGTYDSEFGPNKTYRKDVKDGLATIIKSIN